MMCWSDTHEASLLRTSVAPRRPVITRARVNHLAGCVVLEVVVHLLLHLVF